MNKDQQSKLPPIDQNYWDENRERFQGEMSAIELSSLQNKCEHFIERTSPTEVKCKQCHTGWIDMGRFILHEGKITSIK